MLALQVELCLPRLNASRVDARRRPSGFRPGFWPAGPVQPLYSSELPPACFRPRPTHQQGFEARRARSRKLVDVRWTSSPKTVANLAKGTDQQELAEPSDGLESLTPPYDVGPDQTAA